MVKNLRIWEYRTCTVHTQEISGLVHKFCADLQYDLRNKPKKEKKIACSPLNTSNLQGNQKPFSKLIEKLTAKNMFCRLINTIYLKFILTKDSQQYTSMQLDIDTNIKTAQNKERKLIMYIISNWQVKSYIAATPYHICMNIT